MRTQAQGNERQPARTGSVAPAAREAASPPAFVAGALAPGALGSLQRTVGNAVVLRMLEAQRHDGGRHDGPDAQRSSVRQVLQGSGRPLDPALRSEMEARLNADFSDVRLHTGNAARASAGEVGARAYTSGSHIVIGSGGADKHTLAHELTHVVQQRSGPVLGTDNGAGLRISDPSDRFERAAEANAKRVMASPTPSSAEPVGVRREDRREDDEAGTGRPTAHQASAVQRLGTLGPGEFTAERTSEDTTAHFTRQETEAKVVVGAGNGPGLRGIPDVVRYPTVKDDPGTASLRVADDHTLAVHDVPEPKEFYAVPEVVRNANAELERANSTVRLVGGGPTLTIGGTRLYRVQPTLADTKDLATTDEFVSLVASTCVTVASRIMGSAFDQSARVVLADGESGFAIGARPSGDPGLSSLAATIAQDGRQALSVEEAVRAAETRQSAGDGDGGTYGEAIRGGGRGRTAERLGVNEYALPSVGEGYATFSNDAADGLDHSVKPAADRGEDVWRYHFAAVVARSLDGSCQVTLENYARNDFRTVLREQLYRTLYERATKNQAKSWFPKSLPLLEKNDDVEKLTRKFDTIARQLCTDPAVIKGTLGVERVRLQKDFENHTGQAWFFRAYGGRPGGDDSFHASQAASGFFNNPLTVRVRKPAAGG